MWERVSLNEICQKITDGSHNPPKGIEFSDYLMLSSKNIIGDQLNYDSPRYLSQDEFVQENKRTNLKFGDVLLTIVGTIGRSAVFNDVDKYITLQRSVAVLKPKHDRIISEYLKYALDSQLPYLESQARGVAQKGIYLNVLNKIQIPLPPLPEQKRIVAILDEAFAGIDTAIANTEKAITSAREMFESELNNTFIRQGEGWSVKSLGAVCKFHGGSQPPKAVFKYEECTDYIRLIQIRDYKSDNHKVYIPKALAKRFCNPDDVMIGRYGPPLFQILRGISGAYNVALMKASPNEKELLKEYLFYFLKNKDILRYIENASSRAAGQIGLNKETIEPYSIPFPVSLEEQKAIVTKLDNLCEARDTLIANYTQKLAKLQELKQSLLNQAFSGKLTADKDIAA